MDEGTLTTKIEASLALKSNTDPLAYPKALQALILEIAAQEEVVDVEQNTREILVRLRNSAIAHIDQNIEKITSPSEALKIVTQLLEKEYFLAKEVQNTIYKLLKKVPEIKDEEMALLQLRASDLSISSSDEDESRLAVARIISVCRNFSDTKNQELLSAQSNSLKTHFDSLYNREAYYFYKLAIEICEKNPNNQICLNELIETTYNLFWNHEDIISGYEVGHDKFTRFQNLISNCADKPDLIIGLLQTIDKVCYQKDEGARSWVGDLILALTKNHTSFSSAAADSLSQFVKEAYYDSSDKQRAECAVRTLEIVKTQDLPTASKISALANLMGYKNIREEAMTELLSVLDKTVGFREKAAKLVDWPYSSDDERQELADRVLKSGKDAGKLKGLMERL